MRVCCFPVSNAAATVGREPVDISPDAHGGGEQPNTPWRLARLVQWALTPASDEQLAALVEEGKTDAARWLDKAAGL